LTSGVNNLETKDNVRVLAQIRSRGSVAC